MPGVDFMVECFKKILLYLAQSAGNPGTCSQPVSPTAKFAAHFANIDIGIFRAGADTDISVLEFLEEDSSLDAFDSAEVVDDALIVLGKHPKFAGHGERQGKRGDPILTMEFR